jgi:glycosyltransferase involved in cell wall biosynthesis
MPSRGEAFGLVFAEASSFALPSIATKVGGLPEVIREGVNGFTFPLDTGPAGYADAIQRIVADRDAYRKLAFSTFSEFETRLNWRTAINQMLHEMQSLLSSDPRLPRARAA